MKNLSQFFKDDNGNLSATRLGFLLWTLSVLVVWCVICISTLTLHGLDTSIVSVIAILMTGKVAQKMMEPTADKPS